MEERIKQRIAEIQQAEQEAVKQLTAIRTVLAELQALLEPETSGERLGEQSA
jgi:hypothetical protein